VGQKGTAEAMSTIDYSAYELALALKVLAERWESTKRMWNDPVCWRFEKEYWVPLASQVNNTQREAENLAKVIAQAQRSIQ